VHGIPYKLAELKGFVKSYLEGDIS
jgi:hypothetical protein